MDRPPVSMCLYWALNKWIREGGYLLLRRSVHLPASIAHVLHENEYGAKTHYVPKKKPRIALSTLFGFEGTVLKGDKDLPDRPMSLLGVYVTTVLAIVLIHLWITYRVMLVPVRILKTMKQETK